jgi:hypothetical protein
LVLGNEYGKRGSHYSTIPFDYALQGLNQAGSIMVSNDYCHCEVIRCLEKRLTKGSKERIHRINQSFQKTVYTLLSLMRLYSQS